MTPYTATALKPVLDAIISGWSIERLPKPVLTARKPGVPRAIPTREPMRHRRVKDYVLDPIPHHDESVLDTMARQYGALLLRVAHDDADKVQTAYAKLLASGKQYASVEDTLHVAITTIRRLWCDDARARERMATRLALYAVSQEQDRYSPIDSMVVRAAMRKLPARYRAILILRAQDMDYDAIGRRLSMRADAVRMLSARARQALRELVG